MDGDASFSGKLLASSLNLTSEGYLGRLVPQTGTDPPSLEVLYMRGMWKGRLVGPIALDRGHNFYSTLCRWDRQTLPGPAPIAAVTLLFYYRNSPTLHCSAVALVPQPLSHVVLVTSRYRITMSTVLFDALNTYLAADSQLAETMVESSPNRPGSGLPQIPTGFF